MPRLDGKGPDGQGSGTGRKLGKCSNLTEEDKEKKIGVGMGKGRKGNKTAGQGKRLQSGIDKN